MFLEWTKHLISLNFTGISGQCSFNEVGAGVLSHSAQWYIFSLALPKMMGITFREDLSNDKASWPPGDHKACSPAKAPVTPARRNRLEELPYSSERDREWKSISGLFSYLFTMMFSTKYFSNLANIVRCTRTQRHKNPILAPQQSFLFFQLTLTCLIPGSVFTCSGVSYSIYCLSCAVVWIISSTTTQFCSLLTILLVMWDSWLFIKFQCSLGGCPLMLLFPKQKQTSSHCFLSPSW